MTVALLAIAGLYVLGARLLSSEDGGRSSRPGSSFRLAPDAPRLPPVAAEPRSGPVGARLLRRTLLRASPGGRPLLALGRRTGYGSRRVLAVVERRGDWLGVLSHYRRRSKPGWIPKDSAVLVREAYRLDVDLSKRRILVRRDGRALRRIVVAVGRPGTTTPTGRFGVTDSLLIGKRSGAYGCCALALSGRQPNLPQGWTGGDRIAIHGTANEATLGSAVTSGCLRAGEADMRWLLRRIPLGAPVRIRA